MAGPLKFKAYVPAQQKRREPKYPPISARKPEKAAPTETDGQTLPHARVEDFNDVDDQHREDLASFDWAGFDSDNELPSFEELLKANQASDATASNGTASEKRGMPSSLSGTPEMLQCNSRSQESAIIIEDDSETDQDDETPQTPTSTDFNIYFDPGATADHSKENQRAGDFSGQQTSAQIRPAIARPTSLRSEPGAYEPGICVEACPPPLVADALAADPTEAPSSAIQSTGDEEGGISEDLEAGRHEDAVESTSIQAKRPFEDSPNSNETNDERMVKRLRTSATDRPGTSLGQLVDSPVTPVGLVASLLPPRENSHRQPLSEESDRWSAANAYGDDAIAKVHGSRQLRCSVRRDRRRSNSAAAECEGLISPPASNHSDATVSSPQQSLSHLHRDATTVEVAEAHGHGLSRVEPPIIALEGGEEMAQTGQCKSCKTFRAALLQISSIVQHLLAGVADNGMHGQQPQQHCNLSRPPPTPRSNGEPDEASSGMDEHTNSGESEGDDEDGDDEDGDDDNHDDYDYRYAKPSSQRRRLSPLEERRVRAWKREGKSKSWIVSKLRASGSTSGQPRPALRTLVSRGDKALTSPKAKGKKHSQTEIEEHKNHHTRTPRRPGHAKRVSRTRTPFSPAQDCFLIELKEGQTKLSWKKIHEQFSATYPGRSENTLQVHYCTKLKRREETDVGSDSGA